MKTAIASEIEKNLKTVALRRVPIQGKPGWRAGLEGQPLSF
jgi:hypothetical protein